MKSYRKLTEVTVSSTLSFLTLLPLPLLAQVPSQPASGSGGPNLDDLPSSDYPQQLKTWRCQQGDKAIAVEAKATPIWKEVIEGNGWKCTEQLSVIPGGDLAFSCEPQETIGILTVIWLAGKGGKQQIQDWMGELSKRNLTCTASPTTQYWE